jgi:hypothetical protein
MRYIYQIDPVGTSAISSEPFNQEKNRNKRKSCAEDKKCYTDMYVKIKSHRLMESIIGVDLKQGGHAVFIQE